MRWTGHCGISSPRDCVHLCLSSSYPAFCARISSNLTNSSIEDVIAQINSYDEIMKFFTLIKDTTMSEFPPTTNQTQLTSSDLGRRHNNGQNIRGRNGGQYTPRCQLCGQIGNCVLEWRELFNKSFYGHQNALKNLNNQMFPQAYTTNMQPLNTP